MPCRPAAAILLPVAACLAAGGLATARGDMPRIDWQPDTVRLIHPGGLYGRIRMLPDGTWLCGYERGGQSWTKRSRDRGASWEPPVLMGAFAGGGAANPELCVLGNGQVLGLYNERPREENGPHPYTIRLCHSPDGGRTWTQMAVYVGDPQARNFTHRSLPFGPSGAAARWNSLFVIDEHAVLALASTRINGQHGLWCVTGEIVRTPGDRFGPR